MAVIRSLFCGAVARVLGSPSFHSFLKGRGLPLMLIGGLLSIGCANIRVATEDLPIGVERGLARKDPVPVYERGLANPNRGLVPFAQMGAHGAQNSTRDDLKKALAKKAAEMGADAVFVNNQEVNNGATVTSYGGGVAVSQQTQFLSMYGQACMYAPVRVGVSFGEEFKITDVVPGGPASRAGWRIGDRLLAIGGVRLTGNPLGYYQAIIKAKPGDTLEAELVGPDNAVRKAPVKCEANT